MGKRKNPLVVAGVAPTGTPVMRMLDPNTLKMDLSKNRQAGFDKESIESLAGSIKAQGMLEPVIVQEKANGEMWVVDGHRRTTAALTLENFLVPAIVKPELTDEQEFIIKITANEHREDASPIDRATSMIYAKETLKWNQNKIAEIFDCYPADVSRDLSLLRLPKKTQDQLHKGKITMKDALKLVPLTEAEKQKIADEADKKIREMEEQGATDPEIRREVTKDLEQKVPSKKPKGKGSRKPTAGVSMEDIANNVDDNGDHVDDMPEEKPEQKTPKNTNRLPKPEPEQEDRAKKETSLRLAGLARLLTVFTSLETDSPESFGGRMSTILMDLFDNQTTNEEAMTKIAELG